MSALRWGQARPAASAPRHRFDRFVLPRFLRRPARLFDRVFAGEVEAPRYAATLASIGLLAATGIYGAVLGGHAPAVISAVTARSGFAVEEVRITGHHETSEIDILERLGLDGWTALIGLDAGKARAAIADLPWVDSVAVRKVYPDTVDIAITERRPFAIWQHGRQLSIIEKSGAVIAPFAGGRHAALPLVLGMGAPETAAQFVAKVEASPELASRIKGYIRVGDRRWNLRLESGVTVKLPERGEDAALAAVLRLDREQGLLSRDIVAVDMRLEDRLVIQLTPEAVVRRDAALKERQKTLKAEKRI